ncbi:MAG TPA: hypothetical protein VFF30_03375 [Nitrososphaerales archaeon]|nr:hypothetical protein [Nitrososphaerales archaeon]
MIFKDYSNSSTTISSIRYDNISVSNSSLEFDSGCNEFTPESECGLTLLFGAGALQLPQGGSTHSLTITIGSGEKVSFEVTVGVTVSLQPACTNSLQPRIALEVVNTFEDSSA